MPPNLRKPQPNLSKPSEGGNFEAERKPTSKPTNPLRSGLNFTGERELGTIGGIKSTAKLTVGIDNLIGQQGISVEIDANNQTVGFGAGIGSTKGKLGVNIGGKVGYDGEGNLSVKGAEIGVNIGGFGGGASIDEDEGVRGSVSIAGAKVEIGVTPDGKKVASLCYGVPGAELCITFEPDDEDNKTPQLPISPPAQAPKPSMIKKCVGGEWLPWGAYYYYNSGTGEFYRIKEWIDNEIIDKPFMQGLKNRTFNSTFHQAPEPPGEYSGASAEVEIGIANFYYGEGNWTVSEVSFSGIFPEIVDTGNGVNETGYVGNWKFSTGGVDPWQVKNKNNPIENGIISARWSYKKNFFTPIKRGTRSEFMGIGRNYTWELRDLIPAPNCPNGDAPPESPPPPLLTINKIQLPNHPQHLKRMNCCDKVEKIYKYLGIAKLKRNKFPVSNTFLAPGGSGNDNCLDYYAIMQALFRMLANGLIINPKSKPLGSEWQNANATAWASAMYEMMAESMSDGNSTQRFEVATIMQLAQIMSTLSENGRKIEFVADAIGIEPVPVSEDVPICFTVYEGHKGFGKKERKKINVSGLKTDDDVEKVLGKMLTPSLIPITAWKFKPGQISINEALRNG
jgi:hypothetical protein